MADDRFLEFHDSKLIAVSLTPEHAVIELESQIYEWVGADSERHGTSWWQHVRLEIATLRASSLISDLSAWIWDGSVRSQAFRDDDDGDGVLTIPVVLDGAVTIRLENLKGEWLDIAGTRLSGTLIGEPNSIQDLPSDRDPERGPS